jgi:cytochrome c-type biogenesis protein CcmH/NrfF
MENLLWLLPLLACPIGMVLMMVLMGKGMSMGRKQEEAKEPTSVAELRAEQERLSAQLDSLEGRNGSEASDSERPHART